MSVGTLSKDVLPASILNFSGFFHHPAPDGYSYTMELAPTIMLHKPPLSLSGGAEKILTLQGGTLKARVLKSTRWKESMKGKSRTMPGP